jgi:hypothetical protein
MAVMRTYKIRWAVSQKVEVYSMPAASAADARKAFDTVKLPGVRVLSVELAEGSDDEAAGKLSPLRPRPPGPLRAAEGLPDEPPV